MLRLDRRRLAEVDQADPAYVAASQPFGKPLVNSLFTLGLMIGISVNDTTIGTTVGNLGMSEVKFPHPVFHGDTIHVETEVKTVRESKSRPADGIVTFIHRAFNQDDVLVAMREGDDLAHELLAFLRDLRTLGEAEDALADDEAIAIEGREFGRVELV